jgi:signal transduction histidine kinase
LQLKLVESRATIERQEKLASLGVLAAGVAHEIRNPLTAIKARLFTLKKAVRESLRAVEDANVIEREISRLERIVRDVLLFARPAEPRRETASAVVLLRGIRDLMRSQLENSDIELTVEDSTEITIHGDQNQLKQVLINLVRNGAESIGERGKIVLRAGTERVSLGGRPTNVAILEVQDNGIFCASKAWRWESTNRQSRIKRCSFSNNSHGTATCANSKVLCVERCS